MPKRFAQRPVAAKSEPGAARGRRWLFAIALSLGVSAYPGLARSEESSADVARQRAAETFRQGVEAFDRRDFETARVAFLQTLALRPREAAVQRNLGLAEIYSGHYLDGARRLARVLQTTSQGSSEERSRMQESLKKAETQLQRLTIEVDTDGAEIVVEGTELGRSPLPFAWYVAPGPYDLGVSKPGFQSVTRAGLAQAGKAEHLRIELEPSAADGPPPAPPAARSAPPAGPDMPPPARHGGVNPWLIAGGATLSAAGLATGVAFSVLANDNAGKAEDLAEDIPSGRNCRSDPPSPCPAIQRALEAHDRQVNYAVVGYTAGGALAVLTIVYALWLAPEETDEPKAAVVVDGERAGIVVSGSF
jgi:hypothetical protein